MAKADTQVDKTRLAGYLGRETAHFIFVFVGFCFIAASTFFGEESLSVYELVAPVLHFLSVAREAILRAPTGTFLFAVGAILFLVGALGTLRNKY